MTQEFNRDTGTSSAHASGVLEDFKAMPLEQKISSLFRMELETLNEMLKAGADCAISALQTVGDTISTFGTTLEQEAKTAAEANKTADSGAPHSTAYAPPAPEPPAYPTDAGYTPPGRSDNSFE